jgi:hypothetical protein
MNADERTLILDAQKGDQWAFERLITPYDRRILHMALDMVGNLEDAQDVYQEALVEAFRALPGFRLQSSLLAAAPAYVVDDDLLAESRRQLRGGAATQPTTIAVVGPAHQTSGRAADAGGPRGLGGGPAAGRGVAGQDDVR